MIYNQDVFIAKRRLDWKFSGEVRLNVVGDGDNGIDEKIGAGGRVWIGDDVIGFNLDYIARFNLCVCG